MQTSSDDESPITHGTISISISPSGCLSHYIYIMMMHKFNNRKIDASFIFPVADVLIKNVEKIIYGTPICVLVFVFSTSIHSPDLFPLSINK